MVVTMEIPIKKPSAQDAGSIKLPKQFKEPVRLDLIKKAVEQYWANNRQPYGAYPEAGKDVSAKLSRRRKDYRGAYGHGISRVPRKILLRRGTRMHWVGALAPGTVGGRRAHPPKAEKLWEKKMNVKEKRKAMRSALSATLDPILVKKRGHHIPSFYPFVLTDDVESISKAKELVTTLLALGYEKELARATKKKIRSGKGKIRGRKYKQPLSLLVVVSKPCPLKRIGSIPGIDICEVDKLNIHDLAPGAMPGRATLFTESAIKKIEAKKLFL